MIHLLSYICDHISNNVDVLLIFHLPGLMIYHIHTTYYNAATIPQLALYTHNVTEHTHKGVCNTFCKDIWLIPQLTV